MQLNIKPDYTVEQLQENFSAYFPFLSIRIFCTPAPLPHTTLRKASMGRIREGVLKFTADTTVAALEREFKEKFNLKVQVFRRSASIWLETTITDKWTLAQQNKHGEESTIPERENEIPDYGLSRDED